MRHLMSFNMRICVKRHHTHKSAFLFFLFFYWRYYSKYYLEYVITLKIKSSLVPISNHPKRFSIKFKRKNHTDNTLSKLFLLNSVRRLQKLKWFIYRRGALLQEFGVRGKPRRHHTHNSAFLFVLFLVIDVITASII